MILEGAHDGAVHGVVGRRVATDGAAAIPGAAGPVGAAHAFLSEVGEEVVEDDVPARVVVGHAVFADEAFGVVLLQPVDEGLHVVDSHLGVGAFLFVGLVNIGAGVAPVGV